jgi:hypothetical protein
MKNTKYIVTLDSRHVPSIADACRELGISRPTLMHKLKAERQILREYIKGRFLTITPYIV